MTNSTEEAATNGDGQVAKTEEEKPRYPWEAVLGKEERKEEQSRRMLTRRHRYSHRNRQHSRVMHSRKIRRKSSFLITG